MRPTVPQSKVPSSPPPDPAASLAVIGVLFLALVVVEHPVWTATLAGILLTAFALHRAAHVFRQGYFCVPRTEICVRVAPR